MTAEWIAASDRNTHRRLLLLAESIARCDESLAEISRRRDEMARELEQRARRLHERYGLSTDGREGIMDDGRIIRDNPRAGSRAMLQPRGDDGDRIAAQLEQERQRHDLPPGLGDIPPVGSPNERQRVR